MAIDRPGAGHEIIPAFTPKEAVLETVGAVVFPGEARSQQL